MIRASDSLGFAGKGLKAWSANIVSMRDLNSDQDIPIPEPKKRFVFNRNRLIPPYGDLRSVYFVVKDDTRSPEEGTADEDRIRTKLESSNSRNRKAQGNRAADGNIGGDENLGADEDLDRQIQNPFARW